MDGVPLSRPVSFETPLQLYSIMKLGDNVELTTRLKSAVHQTNLLDV